MSGADTWSARYARSQAALEKAAAANEREWAGREFGSTNRLAVAPNGQEYRVRRVGPGDAVDHGFAVAVAGFLSSLLSHGVPMVESSNSRWVVVVDVVRGLLQRNRRIKTWVVADGASAKRLQAELVSFITAGGRVEDYHSWPEWVPKA